MGKNRYLYIALLVGLFALVPVDEVQSFAPPNELDCGYMAIFLLLRDRDVPVRWEELNRKIFGLTGKREGLSLLDIGEILQLYGINTRSWKMTSRKLLQKSNPFIALVRSPTGENHFVYGSYRDSSDLRIFDLYAIEGLLNRKQFKEKYLNYAIVIE